MSTEYSNVTWINLEFTDPPNAADVIGATYGVEQENERRARAGEELLPYSNGAELKASYEIVMLQLATSQHDKHIINGAKHYAHNLTADEQIQLNIALAGRLKIDETDLATLISDIES